MCNNLTTCKLANTLSCLLPLLSFFSSSFSCCSLFSTKQSFDIGFLFFCFFSLLTSFHYPHFQKVSEIARTSITVTTWTLVVIFTMRLTRKMSSGTRKRQQNFALWVNYELIYVCSRARGKKIVLWKWWSDFFFLVWSVNFFFESKKVPRDAIATVVERTDMRTYPAQVLFFVFVLYLVFISLFLSLSLSLSLHSELLLTPPYSGSSAIFAC